MLRMASGKRDCKRTEEKRKANEHFEALKKYFEVATRSGCWWGIDG